MCDPSLAYHTIVEFWKYPSNSTNWFGFARSYTCADIGSLLLIDCRNKGENINMLFWNWSYPEKDSA